METKYYHCTECGEEYNDADSGYAGLHRGCDGVKPSRYASDQYEQSPSWFFDAAEDTPVL